jgi:hypothetical protein
MTQPTDDDNRPERPPLPPVPPMPANGAPAASAPAQYPTPSAQHPQQQNPAEQRPDQPFPAQPAQQYPAQPTQQYPAQQQSQQYPGQQPNREPYPAQQPGQQQPAQQPQGQPQPTQQWPAQPAQQYPAQQPNQQQPTQQYPAQPTQQYPAQPSQQRSGQQPPQNYGAQQPTAPQQYPNAQSRPAAQQPTAAQQQGTPYTGPIPPTGSGPSGQSGAETPRKKRRRGPIIAIISSVVVLILLIAGGIVGYSVGTAAHAPENQVTAYLDALVDGDAAEALKLAGTEVDADADVLLTNKAYAEVVDRPSAYEIGRTTTSGDTATVTATVTQGDTELTEEFTLQKDGKDAIFFDKWALEEVPLGTITVGMTGPSAVAPAVGGIAIPEGAESLRALPGTYEVGLAEDNEFYSVEAQQVTVEGFTGSAAAPSADLTVALTDAGTQKANDAVNAWLDACQASTEFDPAGCSFYATGKNPAYTYTNTTWKLEPRPTFTIGEWNGTGYRVSTGATGQANLTADIRDNASGATGTATAGPIPVFVNGDITEITADGATFVSSISRG